jgi:eukaryotic-like serine/threonine-protein kinase
VVCISALLDILGTTDTGAQGFAMRAWRMLWRRIRGWWLVMMAAAAVAALAAIGRVHTGVWAAVMVAVGSAIAAVISERGRSHLADQAKGDAKDRTPVDLTTVAQLPDPIKLGVHPAAEEKTPEGHIDQVPPFIERDQLAGMEQALLAGGFVLVVGDSTAGKTRLAYEAMRRRLPRHTCVTPKHLDAIAAAVSAAKETRPSVLWLDDLERYLRLGGLTRDEVADLLKEGAGKVVVLATMRAQEREAISARYDPGREHSDRQLARTGREVLDAVTHEIRLERRWSPGELAAAELHRDDPRIARALRSAAKHGLAEFMAAGPQLLQDLRDARSATPDRLMVNLPGGPRGDPRGAALVTAAIDARRAGYHRPVPLPLLRDLHEVYLRAWGGAALRPDPWDTALAWATQPLHATSSLLEPADDGYLAFDYLVDEAARDPTTPPIPDATWKALIQHAEPADAVEIAWQASFAGRIEQVEPAFARALAAHEYLGAAQVASCLGEAGHERRAIELLEATIARAEADPSVSPEDLLTMRRALAWQIGEKVSGHGDPHRALQIARQVLRDSITVHGAAHPETLFATVALARQVGAAGDPNRALTLAREIDAEATATLGADHETTLRARFEIAHWTREVDGAAAAAEEYAKLIEQMKALEPEPWSAIIDVMWNLGSCLSDVGDHARAVQISAAAIEQARQAYGDTHIRVLRMRLTHIRVVGLSGDPGSAATLGGRLASDCAELLGESHLTTLEARHELAYWTAAAGDPETAIPLYHVLQADLGKFLDHDHWLTQQNRAELADLEQQGDPARTDRQLPDNGTNRHA